MDYVYCDGKKNWHVGDCVHGYAADGWGRLVSGGAKKTYRSGWPNETRRALYYDYESHTLYLMSSHS